MQNRSRTAWARGDPDGGSAMLMAAVQRYRPNLVKLLLERGADPNQEGDYGHLALDFAVNLGQTEVINLLLDHGADVNGGSRMIPLITAICTAGWTEVVKLLIARGADVNLRGSGSMTPLECALISGHEEIAAPARTFGWKTKMRSRSGPAASVGRPCRRGRG